MIANTSTEVTELVIHHGPEVNNQLTYQVLDLVLIEEVYIRCYLTKK